jgi:hypothetical protein
MPRLACNALLPSRWLSKISTRSISHTPSLASRSPDQRFCPKIEWRTLFRSSDYDDAWSPYIPIPVSLDKLNGGKLTQHGPVKALVEGRWEKRRHGMNLEPLLLHPRVYEETTKIDNPTKSSKDGDNEIQQARSQARGRLKWLDSQTRFLCSMLDDLYRTGIRRQIDRARTERCHRVSVRKICEFCGVG